MALKRTTTKKPAKKSGAVSKSVKVTGKRIGSVQRANQARQQKRRDSRR